MIPTDEETKFYKGPNNDQLPNMKDKIKDISRQGCTDDIGAWPVDPEEARKTGAVYAVREFEKLNNIHGTEHPMLLRFITSNDYGHMGEMILPAGGYGPRCSDPDVHAGDGALYCVEGRSRLIWLISKKALCWNRKIASSSRLGPNISWSTLRASQLR